MILVRCLLNNFVSNFVVGCWISSLLLCFLLIVLVVDSVVFCYGGLADELGHASLGK